MDIKDWEQKFFRINEELYELAKDPPKGHGPGHHLRVWRGCKKLAKKYNGDLGILVAAALLHNISAYVKEIDPDKHSEETPNKVAEVLEEAGYPKERIPQVLEVINSDLNVRKISIEAKILCDADKLDDFGAIGVARVIASLTLRGKDLNDIVQDFYYKGHLKRKWQTLFLKQSRKIGKKDYKYTLKFFSKLARKVDPISNA